MDRRVRRLSIPALVLCSLATMGGLCDSAMKPLVVTAGAWSYVVMSNNGVPLPGGGGPTGCTPPNLTGTTMVDASGNFSIPYAFAPCSNCVMSGTIVGTISPTRVTGSVTASLAGTGCTNGQPHPSPAAEEGDCTASGCNVGFAPDVTPANGLSFGINYTLSPP